MFPLAPQNIDGMRKAVVKMRQNFDLTCLVGFSDVHSGEIQ
jgi:hypothetical protein